MASKYRQPILDYCACHGVDVPAGFARHTPSRYAVIRKDSEPPKLVATTWFKVADIIYYIEKFIAPDLSKGVSDLVVILDFETRETMEYQDRRLVHRSEFSCAHSRA